MDKIIVLFIIISIVSSIVRAAKGTQQNSGGNVGARPSAGANGAARQGMPARTGAYTGSATSDQRARLEQLRRQQQRQAVQNPHSNARPISPNAEKPVYPHETEDCGGGSIHDGYHEGTVKRPAPASSAEGRLGRQGVLEKEGRSVLNYYNNARVEEPLSGKTAAPAAKQTAMQSQSPITSAAAEKEASGAERLSKAISGKPAIVQGLIWAEVLGRPLSDS